MDRTAFALVALVCVLLLSQSAYAQQVPPRSYLFVEVADQAGKAVGDATVRVLYLEGKEVVSQKTHKDGTANANFHRDGRLHHYDLQIQKSGYLPYESVLFPTTPHDHYYTRLIEDIPSVLPPLAYAKGPAVKVTLKNLSPAELRNAESEAKKQQLLLTIKRGDALNVKKLLDQGADPNSADSKDVPAIAWATFAGDPETIKLLLNTGANVRKRTNLAREALLLYLAEGLQRNPRVDKEIVIKLIEAGADVNASNSYHGTILNRAILHIPHILPLETVKALIKAGADVNAADTWGQTPLQLATRQNQKEVVDFLLSLGAKSSIHAKDKEGRTALFYAAGYYRGLALPIFEALMANGANVNDADYSGITPLMMAAKISALEIIQPLLRAGASINLKDKQGQTALMHAVTQSYTTDAKATQTVKLLLDAGAQVNEVDVHGRSALMYAASVSSDHELIKALLAAGANANLIDVESQTALQSAVKRYPVEIIQTLLKAGAASSINTKNNQGSTALHYAAESYNTENVRALIAAGALVDAVNAKGETPLIIAVKRNIPDTVKLLLASRASIDIKDNEGNTALVYAKVVEVEPESVIFNALISAGANPNLVNDNGDNLLMIASSSKYNTATVRGLLNTAAKNSLNARNKRGEAALLNATVFADPETVAVLLAAGANVNDADISGQTALMRALGKYDLNLDLVKQLIKAGANVNATDARGQPALLYFRPYEANDLVRSIFKELIAAGVNVNAVDADGRTPLISFAERRNVALVQMAIDAGANVNAKDKTLRTALFYALPDNRSLVDTSREVEVVKALIAARADVNVADQNGVTPLMLAADQHSWLPVRMLLTTGAEINATDKAGQSALMRAAMVYDQKELPYVLKTLIAEKATVDAPNESGQTPLMLAARTGDIKAVQALIDAGASVKAKDKEGKTALTHAADEWRSITTSVVGALIAAGANVNEADAQRQTPLMLAALRDGIDNVKLLLKAGAAVSAKDEIGQTPLMFAAWGGSQSSPEIVTALLNAKAKVNDSDKDGKSVLMFAAYYAPLEVVQLVLGARPSINARNTSGHSALMFAIMSSRDEARQVEKVKLLLQAGADVNLKDNEGQTAIDHAQRLGKVALVKLIQEFRR